MILIRETEEKKKRVAISIILCVNRNNFDNIDEIFRKLITICKRCLKDREIRKEGKKKKKRSIVIREEVHIENYEICKKENKLANCNIDYMTNIWNI